MSCWKGLEWISLRAILILKSYLGKYPFWWNYTILLIRTSREEMDNWRWLHSRMKSQWLEDCLFVIPHWARRGHEITYKCSSVDFLWGDWRTSVSSGFTALGDEEKPSSLHPWWALFKVHWVCILAFLITIGNFLLNVFELLEIFGLASFTVTEWLSFNS